MSREAVRMLQERRQMHTDAVNVIDAALRELGAVGVRKSRATRRGSNDARSNGGGSDRMQGHDAIAVRRGTATPAQLKRVNTKRANMGLKPVTNGHKMSALIARKNTLIRKLIRKPVASLAEAAVAD